MNAWIITNYIDAALFHVSGIQINSKNSYEIGPLSVVALARTSWCKLLVASQKSNDFRIRVSSEKWLKERLNSFEFCRRLILGGLMNSFCRYFDNYSWTVPILSSSTKLFWVRRNTFTHVKKFKVEHALDLRLMLETFSRVKNMDQRCFQISHFCRI